MTTEDFIIHLFCLVEDTMEKRSKHPQAHLYASEVVTIGLLFALKGGYFRAFYRWLERDYAGLFAGLPERTRLQRLLRTLWRRFMEISLIVMQHFSDLPDQNRIGSTTSKNNAHAK